MAHKAIREADGKLMLARLFKEYSDGKYEISDKVVSVGPDTDLAKLPKQYEWLSTEKFVVKPDQLIKRRGKNKLILVGANYRPSQSLDRREVQGAHNYLRQIRRKTENPWKRNSWATNKLYH